MSVWIRSVNIAWCYCSCEDLQSRYVKQAAGIFLTTSDGVAMRMRLRSLSELAAAMFVVAGAGSACAAPAQLYGRSVIVTWTEDREQRFVDQQFRVFKNPFAEQRREFPGIGRVTQFFGNDFVAAAIHLTRIEQRT